MIHPSSSYAYNKLFAIFCSKDTFTYTLLLPHK